ncbi:MAG: GIY-YIG nuclease family protein [Gemmatimonadaceae bacterium]|nr:GIY-YIG nuclease family protein [Gemmatimonadaceae bacterium]
MQIRESARSDWTNRRDPVLAAVIRNDLGVNEYDRDPFDSYAVSRPRGGGIGIEDDPRELGSVYFIWSPETHEIKIGRSLRPDARLRHLQSAHPHELKLLRTVPGGPIVERVFHAKYAEQRLHGEWFDDSIIDDLLSLLSDVA